MKSKIILASLVGLNLFAMEGKLETGINVEPVFSNRVGDKENNIDASPFRYERTKYDLKLLDLSLNFKEQGINLGTTLKSSRENSILNDWNYNVKDSETKKRMKSHDIMAKIYANYESPEFYGLKSKTDLTYYVDNLIGQREIDKDKAIVKDYEIPSEYIEKDKDGKLVRNALGNMIFKTSLVGDIKESKTKLDTSIEYKANQFGRFDKDESYFKTNIKVDQELDKVKLNASHNLDWDLHFGSKPFDPFNTDLDSFPDFMSGNYVNRLKQDANVGLNYEAQGYNLNTDLKLNVDSFFVGGENKTNKVEVVYNVYKPELSFSVEKELKEGLKLRPEINNKFEIRDARYSNISVQDRWGSYKPELKLGLDYTKTYEENNIEYKGNISYGPQMTIIPFVTKGSHIKHEIKTENNVKGKYVLNKDTTFNGESNLSLNLPYQNNTIQPIEFKFKVDGSVEHKVNEKLSLTGKLTNDITIKSQNRVLNPDNFTEVFKASLEGKYIILDKEKEKLNLSSKLTNDLAIIYDYYIKTEKKEAGVNKVDIPYERKIAYLSGNFVPLVIHNVLSLDTKLDYEKELKEGLRLKSGLDVNTKLDLFALRAEKMYHYKELDSELKEGEEKPQLSDYRTRRYNIGGSIEVKPRVSLEYDILSNLKLNAGLNTSLLFERKVFNKIVDDKRPDNGLYGAIDKEFKFKKLVPSINLGLEYRW
ncbi:hypothetical protein [Pseudostreptobacillus hongkongensis]|uniref:hypothetical protein n=1 Tax=Pseudostreptobacillus hongkongensis TaxID=1162717 RepID=UPI00082B08FA|nr:hypothetical protein [Pseudostreptobacillus hongkongensis]